MSSQSSLPTLFRPEVTHSHSQKWVGAIRLAQPISVWLVTCITLSIAVTLIVYLTCGHVTRKARVFGITTPVGGSIGVIAPNNGRISRALVSDGQSVTVGQPLFELLSEHHGEHGEISNLVGQQLAIRRRSLEAEYQLRNAEFAEKKQALAEKINGLTSESVQLEQEITLAERRSNLALSVLSKYQTLQTNGYISSLQLQQKQEDLIDLTARLSNLKRTKLKLQATIAASIAEQKLLVTTSAMEQTRLTGTLASLEQESAENSTRRENLVTAPQSGIVTSFTVQQGQTVNAGRQLATIIPALELNSKLEAQLYAPSRTAGFVAAGQRVYIRYQGRCCINRV